MRKASNDAFSLKNSMLPNAILMVGSLSYLICKRIDEAMEALLDSWPEAVALALWPPNDRGECDGLLMDQADFDA